MSHRTINEQWFADYLRPTKHEMFNVESTPKDYTSLDDALDDALMEEPEIFSVTDFVRGRKPTKKRKTVDVKPIVFITFNSRKGKAKPIMLKALMDSGGSGTLVLSKHAKKLRCKKTASKTVWLNAHP